MKIESSAISMSSFNEHVDKNSIEESLKMWAGNPQTSQSQQPQQQSQLLHSGLSDILDITKEGKAALIRQAGLSAANVEEDGTMTFELSEKDKQKLYFIQMLLEALTGKKVKFAVPASLKLNNGNHQKPDNLELASKKIKNANVQMANSKVMQTQQPVGWGLIYSRNEVHYEKQSISFAASGSIKTEDGRQIDIDLILNMSREFASREDISIRAGDAVNVDPLVINYSSAAAGLTERKFEFDIDTDGINEQISFVNNGSGFLALDLNNDGKINDGSELFGPLSGNGFGEFAGYDSDSNGWIDENDSIYDRLRIWTKDEDGTDRLLALGQTGIGAIYLGNVKTDFDLKNNQNKALGDIASTGIFLREDGSAGTIQHIDLAI